MIYKKLINIITEKLKMLQRPNYTQISNDFIDNYLHKCSGAEAKIFLAITRKTIGWHKIVDQISYSQIKMLTGLSTNALKSAIEKLIKKDLIHQYPNTNGQGYLYDIAMSENDEFSQPTVSKIDRVEPKTVSKIDTTKERNIKKGIRILEQSEKSDILEPKKKKTKKEENMIPYFRPLTDHFFDLHKKRMRGVKPTWGGKETKLLKSDIYRLMSIGEDWHEVLKAAMELFMKDKVKSVADFTSKAGYSYGVFHSCLDKILAAMLERAK